MTHRLALLAAILALGASACASQKAAKYNPFKVQRDQFYGSLTTVAVAPMRAPTDLENADAVKAKFEAAVLAKLHAAGLKVIPPADVGPILDAAAAAQGGVFDPATGEFVEAKANAATQAALGQLKDQYGAGALLRVNLLVVYAELSNDVAFWDGVTENAGGGFWKALLVGSHSGRIPALSIVAFLRAADGTELYAMAGGLRILERLSSRGKVERTPHAELFTDEQRNAQALSIALDPLLGIVPPKPGS